MRRLFSTQSIPCTTFVGMFGVYSLLTSMRVLVSEAPFPKGQDPERIHTPRCVQCCHTIAFVTKSTGRDNADT